MHTNYVNKKYRILEIHMGKNQLSLTVDKVYTIHKFLNLFNDKKS